MTGSSSTVLSVPCGPGTGSAEIRYTRSRRYQAGAVDARDGITETQLLALRDAYFVALDASAILHDGTEQRRRIIKAIWICSGPVVTSERYRDRKIDFEATVTRAPWPWRPPSTTASAV
jgi:hypothetical protein